MTQVKDNPLRQRGSSRDDDGQQRRLTRHHVSNLRPIASRGGGEETYKKKIKKRQRWQRSAPLGSTQSVPLLEAGASLQRVPC